jgi:transposase
MVYKNISMDLKHRALWLLEHDYIPADVSEIFGVSERSLQRWKANQSRYGTVVPPLFAVRGRPRILNSDMTHDLFALLEEAPEMFLDEIQEWLASMKRKTQTCHLEDGTFRISLLIVTYIIFKKKKVDVRQGFPKPL